ncbi:MAG: hypothetical protein JWM85_2817 [Acidimicrobiaceae bacterium]|nr:hypothetical protein [Acidimicrobiaceae bacterium]
MHWDAVVAGLGVGLVVGLTGSGGGALLTPILVLFLGVNAKGAVASDLAASLVMRPVAGMVHLRHETVRWSVVKWLVLGSVPAALISGFASPKLITATATKHVLEPAIGIALILSGGVAIALRVRRAIHPPKVAGDGPEQLRVRPLPTVVIGVIGGLVVGLTSVGSGTLMLVALGILYPGLAPAELVGTDLVQAVPLVAAATLGHLAAGGVHLSLTTSLIVGSVPGAIVGSLVSPRVPAKPLGAIVAGVIFASGCALVGWIPGLALGGVAALALAACALLIYRHRPVQADDEDKVLTAPFQG